MYIGTRHILRIQCAPEVPNMRCSLIVMPLFVVVVVDVDTLAGTTMPAEAIEVVAHIFFGRCLRAPTLGRFRLFPLAGREELPIVLTCCLTRNFLEL